MSGQFKQCTLHLACLGQIVNNLTSYTTCRILEIAVLYLYRSEPRRVIVKCSAWEWTTLENIVKLRERFGHSRLFYFYVIIIVMHIFWQELSARNKTTLIHLELRSVPCPSYHLLPLCLCLLAARSFTLKFQKVLSKYLRKLNS